MHFKKGTAKQHNIAFPETPGVTNQCRRRYSHMKMLVTVYSDRQSRGNLCTSINRHSSFRQTGEVCPFTRHLIRDENKRGRETGILGRRSGGQSQDDTVPTTTQLTVLRPDWVSPLCHPQKDYSVSSPTITSALTLVLIQPWENSGLRVHLLAALNNKHRTTCTETCILIICLRQLRLALILWETQAQMQDLNSD